MRKIIFVLLAIFALVSCVDKTTYTIGGVASGIEDGTEVSLFSDRRGRDVLETVKVEDGKFTFAKRMTVKGDNVIFFGVNGLEGAGSQSRPVPVFVEPGKIAISIEGNAITGVLGTPLNDSNTQFTKSIQSGGDLANELTKDFIKSNSNNALGVYYLERTLYAYELADIKDMVALFPAEFDNNKAIQLVKNYVKTQEETAVGAKFKDLVAQTPSGEKIALSDYAGKGKVVLVDFWASWCPPCRKDMPLLVEAYGKYKDKGFEIVGVSLDKTNEDWTKGLADLNMTWPQMSDLKYWESELGKAYAVRSIPFTVLLDGEGNIIAKKIEGKDLDAKLAELLNK